MHFDDRLATVLRLPRSGDGLARIQFRQLVDILGQAPEQEVTSGAVEAGFARLEELGRQLSSAERARLLDRPLQPITNARLLAWLAEAEPDVAAAAIRAARLSDEAWLALVPRLPVRARGLLRHRSDLPAPVKALLERLGVHDRALPAGACEPDPEAPIPDVPSTSFRPPTGDIALDQDISEDVLDLLGLADDPPQPTSLSEWAQARAAQQQKDLKETVAAQAPSASGEDGIGAIVRRIEAFRKARETPAAARAGSEAPGLPLGDGALLVTRAAVAIDFTTDAEGRIDWADGPYGPSIAGLDLVGLRDEDGIVDLPAALRRRLPLRSVRIEVTGAPAVSGAWQVDAAACFEHAGGRFTGYCGRLRRRAVADAPSPAIASDTAEADRMREILHELRTPANAIQVAAEIIQQQLYGPAPHEYRALAAAIAGDCAHILAGFEELDRLVKLECGALLLDAGECDLARVLAQTVVRLRAWTGPRDSGFLLPVDPSAASLPVRVARVEVERLVWRLFAVLAGSTAPGEKLALSWSLRGAMLDVTVALPAVLAERDPASLYDAIATERSQSLAAGMFGIGFTLRLAAAEAAAAGGGLQRIGDTLRLSLPALAGAEAGDSSSSTTSR
ncbi:histidine kinase [Novosphingobium soli]|uniref:histidine kinase n=1 Tax=Novosphingobium soli TaxID=574956 RepID=A0ABV6CVK9_9SPHN